MRTGDMKKKKEKKEKSLRGLTKFFSESDIDTGAEFYAELRGRNSIAVRGCFGIAEYSEERIGLRVPSGIMTVMGVRLVCDSYVNGAVIVSGHISSVVFGEDEI